MIPDGAVRLAEHIARRVGQGAAPPAEVVARVRRAFGDGVAGLFAPDSADGIAAVLAMCSEEGWPVLPIGAGTWLPVAARGQTGAGAPQTLGGAAEHGGVTEPRPPILLSTARLARIVEHEPADLVIGVEAGLPLEHLAGALKERAQWLPLDPAALPGATIGAAAARADAGPLRAAHGTPRDMLLGVELATGDGRLLRFGGRVVKNVAGYDGVRLVVGSAGRLGVVTRLYLRVRGAPHVDRTLAVACGPGAEGMHRAAGLALAIRAAAAPDALEVLSPAVAGALSGRDGRETGWLVLARMLGSDAAVSEIAARVERVSRDMTGANAGRLSEIPGAVWHALAGIEGSATEALRLTALPTDVGPCLDAAVASLETGASAGWYIAAHAADGIVRVWRRDGAGGAAQAKRTQDARDLAASPLWTSRYDRGTIGPNTQPSATPAMAAADAGMPGAPVHPEAAVQARAPALTDLTRRLTRVFDPAGILSDGRQA